MKNENTITARAQWEEMTGEKQLDALRRMTWTAARRESAKGHTYADWIKTPADAEQVATEAWPDVADVLTAHPEKPLAIVLYRATAYRMRRIYRKELEHVRGSYLIETTDGTETTLDRVYRYSTAHAADRIEGPEEKVVFRLSLQASLADKTDAYIIRRREEGATQTEIAEELGLTQAAIAQRLRAIRSRFHAAD